MKRYIHDDRYTSNFHFDIVVEIEYFDDTTRVAASEYKGFYVPDGPVISGLPDAVLGSQALQDYADFIESVQALITDFYKLKIYYKNSLKDHSNYFGILAKNKDGSIIIDFDFTLRVSNHDPKRSKKSQKHKKEREAELKKLTDGKNTKPIRRNIVVNNERYTSYMKAYVDIDEAIEDVVSIMTRKQKK